MHQHSQMSAIRLSVVNNADDNML